MKKTLLITAAALGLVAIVGGTYYAMTRGVEVETTRIEQGTIHEYVEERGKTRLPKTWQITMPENGRIQAIDLTEGATVSEGQVVAQMVPEDLEIQLDAAVAAVESLEAQIEENNDASVEETLLKQTEAFVESMDHTVEAAEARKVASEARHEYAERHLGRVRELFPTAAKTQEDLDLANVQQVESGVSYREDVLVEQAIKSLQAATNLLPLTVQQTIDRKVLAGNVLRKQRAEANAKLRQVEENVNRGTMHSPVHGVVLEREVSNERQVAAGTVLMTIGDLNQLEIEADLLSEDVVEVKVGDQVEIHGPAVGEKTAQGKVSRVFPAGFTKISSLGVEQQRVKVIIQFEPQELTRLIQERGLGVGYRVRVRIRTAEAADVVLAPQSALIQGDDNQWQVFVVEQERARLRDVEVGLVNDQWVEITQGLKEGEVVVLAPETDLTDDARIMAKVRHASEAR
jgi:HlyD family secretion protein